MWNCHEVIPCQCCGLSLLLGNCKQDSDAMLCSCQIIPSSIFIVLNCAEMTLLPNANFYAIIHVYFSIQRVESTMNDSLLWEVEVCLFLHFLSVFPRRKQNVQVYFAILT